MFIYDVIPNINLQNLDVEFKTIAKGNQSTDSNKRQICEFDWLKDFVAFSNTNGGTIYIGVEKSNFEIRPLNQTNVEQISLMIYRLVKDNIIPSIKYDSVAWCNFEVDSLNSRISLSLPKFMLYH